MPTASYGVPSSPSVWGLWWGYLSSTGHSTSILDPLQCHTLSVELAPPLGALTDHLLAAPSSAFIKTC